MSDPAHLAIACALSPRLRGVLAEASRFAGFFGAKVSILHVGTRSEVSEQQFATAIAEAGLPGETAIHWGAGEPVPTLAGLADAQGVDLLAAGALERDVELQFLSGVARGLLRSARCSLLLFTKPNEQPQPFRRIVVLTDFSPAAAEALRLALHVAEQEKVETLHVLSVFTPFTAARAKLGAEDEGPARHERDEEAMLADFVSGAADSPVPIETRVIHTTTGMGASDFTKTIEADLLVVPAETTPEGETRLPTSMDWVMQVIPCNLWVVKQPAGKG